MGEGATPDEKEIVCQAPRGQLAFSTALFPSYRGYAIFPRLALANHSCEPTCAVEFTFAGTLFLLAQGVGKVQPSTELTISYLDASLGVKVSSSPMAREKRRKLLRPYGFECACPCCIAETVDASPRLQPQKRQRLQ